MRPPVLQVSCQALQLPEICNHGAQFKYFRVRRSMGVGVFIVKKITDVILTAILYVHYAVHVLSVCGNGLTDSHDEFLLNL